MTFFQFDNFWVPNISKTNRVRNLKLISKVTHIIHIQQVHILDWSTERSRRELCLTGGKFVSFFCDFDKENYVLYEFVNRQ